MTKYNWTRFEGKKQLGDKKKPIVSIQSKANMGLNRAAYEALGSPAKIAFFYDKDQKAIAIAPAEEDDIIAYAVKKQAQASSFVITAKAFLAYVDYPFVGQLRYFHPIVENRQLILELDKAFTSEVFNENNDEDS